jgi:hypothetical protein
MSGHTSCGSVTRPSRCLIGLVACFATDGGMPEVAPLDPPRHQIAVRRLAVGKLELAAEVPSRHVCAAGERRGAPNWCGAQGAQPNASSAVVKSNPPPPWRRPPRP